MNVNVFSYSVMASILGILIVFISLCGLSLLMVALKVIFKERIKNLPETKKSPDFTIKKESNDWIMAAVSVFMIEEDSDAPSAVLWCPKNSEKTDQWINRALMGTKK